MVHFLCYDDSITKVLRNTNCKKEENMRRKNRLSIIMTMTLTAGLLAGCGNENISVQSTQGASETADGGSQEAVELELFSTKTENAAILQTIVDGFMKENENITITLTSQPFELTFADSWTCLPPWNSMAPVIPD